MNALNPRERRLIALLILVAAIALAWLGVIRPVLDGFAARGEARAALQLQWARDERAIAALVPTRRLAEAQRAARSSFVLAAATPAAAGDALRERLGATVSALGGELRAVEDVAPPPGFVRARLDARLSTPQLVRLLERVQNEPPYLIVESLTIATEPVTRPGLPSPLDIRLELAAATAAPAPR